MEDLDSLQLQAEKAWRTFQDYSGAEELEAWFSAEAACKEAQGVTEVTFHSHQTSSPFEQRVQMASALRASRVQVGPTYSLEEVLLRLSKGESPW
jgi:hypothetical protein